MSVFYTAICEIIKLLTINYSDSILEYLENETEEVLQTKFENLVRECPYRILAVITDQEPFKNEQVILVMRKVLLERKKKNQHHEYITFKTLNKNRKYITLN